MSSYHNSFSYLGQNSKDNFNLVISHFDPDNGESETGLATESIYTASADGTKRNLYGTKYSGAEPVKITLIKQNGGEFSIDDNRKILRWLTGAKTDSWLDLYIGNKVEYRMFGHVQNVLQYKLDSRIIGIIVVFESASPWAFSDLQEEFKTISGETTITINNDSDDQYGYTSVNVTYKNIVENGSLIIQNAAIENEPTIIRNLQVNEIITLDCNQMITSDNEYKIFGNDFNFIFPKLISGTNILTVTGSGEITFEYHSCIKIGDMAININADTDPICNEYGEIQIDVLSWDRIVNRPTTLSGYGITDVYPISSVYNKNEINNKIDVLTDDIKSATYLASSLSSDLTNNYYNKTQIDKMISEIEIPDSQLDTYTKAEIDAKLSNLEIPDIDISKLDTYTKAEIDAKLQNITASGVDIDEDDLNKMLEEVLK